MKRFAFAAVILAALSLNSNSGRALPGKPAEVGVERLAAQVTIRRDTYGIPHILAKTEEAAAFGLGYAQAEDHCLAIARHLIAARGETAKYLGQGQEGDFLMKRFDNLEVCKKNFGQLDPLLQRIYNAYAEGVNRYVSKRREELPGWIWDRRRVWGISRGRVQTDGRRQAGGGVYFRKRTSAGIRRCVGNRNRVLKACESLFGVGIRTDGKSDLEAQPRSDRFVCKSRA